MLLRRGLPSEIAFQGGKPRVQNCVSRGRRRLRKTVNIFSVYNDRVTFRNLEKNGEIFVQETTGIPGAVNSRRRGRVYPHSRPRPRPNMVIPADNSRPHPRPRRRGRCSVHGPGPGLGQILPPVVYCICCRKWENVWSFSQSTLPKEGYYVTHRHRIWRYIIS